MPTQQTNTLYTLDPVSVANDDDIMTRVGQPRRGIMDAYIHCNRYCSDVNTPLLNDVTHTHGFAKQYDVTNTSHLC